VYIRGGGVVIAFKLYKPTGDDDVGDKTGSEIYVLIVKVVNGRTLRNQLVFENKNKSRCTHESVTNIFLLKSHSPIRGIVILIYTFS